jgi:hypothetical protein
VKNNANDKEIWTIIIIIIIIIIKLALEQATKTLRGSEGVAVLFL